MQKFVGPILALDIILMCFHTACFHEFTGLLYPFIYISFSFPNDCTCFSEHGILYFCHLHFEKQIFLSCLHLVESNCYHLIQSVDSVELLS
jgi:hypothetical protein